MLKGLQITFLVLAGTGFILFSLWSHLHGGGTLLVVAFGATVAYAGAVARTLFGKEDGGLRTVLRKLWTALLGGGGRACAMNALAVGANALLLALLLAPAEPLTLHISLSYEKPRTPSPREPEEFLVSIDVPAGENPKPQRTRHKVAFELPPLDGNTTLVFKAEHPEYEMKQPKETTLDKARGGISLRLESRPRLVVRVTPIDEAGQLQVAAWPVVVAPPTARALANGSAVFLAQLDDVWRVRLLRGDSEEHLSPPFEIARNEQPYTVDLHDALSFPWVERSATLPTVHFMALSARTLESSIGNKAADDVLGRFLFGGAPDDSDVLIRKGYVASYNPKLKVPNWVAYRLVPGKGRVGRTRFRPDPALRREDSAQDSDYRRSGYDRGQLVPASDMARVSKEAVAETYLLSAVAPQTPMLNQGAWLAIEKSARAYVDAKKTWMCVIAGCVFARRERALTIGESRVVVPSHFFRIHLRLLGRNPEVLCFLVPNDAQLDRDPRHYLTSLGDVEQRAGLRFFQELPKRQQPDRTRKPKKLWLDE